MGNKCIVAFAAAMLLLPVPLQGQEDTRHHVMLSETHRGACDYQKWLTQHPSFASGRPLVHRDSLGEFPAPRTFVQPRPPRQFRHGWQATILLTMVLDSTGTVRHVDAVYVDVYPPTIRPDSAAVAEAADAFAKAAIDASERTPFTPGRVRDWPVWTWQCIPWGFQHTVRE